MICKKILLLKYILIIFIISFTTGCANYIAKDLIKPNKNIKSFNHRLEDELKNLSKNKRFKKIKTLRKKELNLFNL